MCSRKWPGKETEIYLSDPWLQRLTFFSYATEEPHFSPLTFLGCPMTTVSGENYQGPELVPWCFMLSVAGNNSTPLSFICFSASLFASSIYVAVQLRFFCNKIQVSAVQQD
jgi:hypothetical protein